MPTTKAQNRAIYNQQKKMYDTLHLLICKGAKAQLQAAAKAAGAKSTTAFLAGIIERETGVKCTLDGEFPARK